MTSLGTDFEMHAIWQGFVEDSTAKDFVARKARRLVVILAGALFYATVTFRFF